MLFGLVEAIAQLGIQYEGVQRHSYQYYLSHFNMIIFANPGCDHVIPLLFNAFTNPVQNFSERVNLRAAILRCTRLPLCLDPRKSLLIFRGHLLSQQCALAFTDPSSVQCLPCFAVSTVLVLVFWPNFSRMTSMELQTVKLTTGPTVVFCSSPARQRWQVQSSFYLEAVVTNGFCYHRAICPHLLFAHQPSTYLLSSSILRHSRSLRNEQRALYYADLRS